MSRLSSHPDQIKLSFGQAQEVDELVEKRAAAQAEAQALYWRLRLVALESVMMAALLFGALGALTHDWLTALRNAAIVGVLCLIAGLATVCLAGLAGQLLTRLGAQLRAIRSGRR
ncbi:hypothetical protein [Novosphingobium rosa]|uniref:hypothetical protein n=1 Tax=Novosphingobium rosa TaxID=76978 RepID=UPI00082A72FD|nr:hypothetical protein [Novosphingobium rosa]